MIEIKDIEIVYDDYIILNKTDIDIPEHAITLIRGISGSGKTSLLYRIGLISEDDHFYYNIEDNNGIERFQSFCKLIENELERYRGNGLLRERIICYLGIFYMDVYDYYVKVRKKIPFRTSLRKEQLIYDFCSLVAENFKNHKNVGFYADKLNITTTYLSAIMNERCGIYSVRGKVVAT